MTIHPNPSAPPGSVGEPVIDLTTPSAIHAVEVDGSSPSSVPTATAWVDTTPYNGPVVPVPTDSVPFSQSLSPTTTPPSPPSPYNNPNLVGSYPQPFQIEPYNNNHIGDSPVPMHLQPKLGSKCCGFCCDMRRAVIILNIMFMIWSTVGLISWAFSGMQTAMVNTSNVTTVDDDEVAQLAPILNDLYLAQNIIDGLGLLASAVPLYGAFKFRWGMVGFGILFLLSQLVAIIVLTEITLNRAEAVTATPMATPITSYILDSIMTALYIYPHAGLMIEIQQGIMTAETLPREDFSCCCTTQPAYPQPYNPRQQQQHTPSAIAYPVEREV